MEIALEKSLATASKVQVALKDLQLQNYIMQRQNLQYQDTKSSHKFSLEIYCILTGKNNTEVAFFITSK